MWADLIWPGEMDDGMVILFYINLHVYDVQRAIVLLTRTHWYRWGTCVIHMYISQYFCQLKIEYISKHQIITSLQLVSKKLEYFFELEFLLQTVVSTCHDVAIAAYRKTQMKHSLGDETETIMETHKSKPGQQYVVPHNCLLFLQRFNQWRRHA